MNRQCISIIELRIQLGLILGRIVLERKKRQIAILSSSREIEAIEIKLGPGNPTSLYQYARSVRISEYND